MLNKTRPIMKGCVIMFSGILLKMEHEQLMHRSEKIKKKLAVQGVTNELLVEMQKLQKDVDDLAGRTDYELEKLGLK